MNPAEAAPPRIKLTYDDFVLFPYDGKRHELIDGEHYVTPSPNRRHQRISGQLYLAIGELTPSVRCSLPRSTTFVEPDLLYVSRERAAEVLIPNMSAACRTWWDRLQRHPQAGRTIKRTLYERAGVSESSGVTGAWARGSSVQSSYGAMRATP